MNVADSWPLFSSLQAHFYSSHAVFLMKHLHKRLRHVLLFGMCLTVTLSCTPVWHGRVGRTCNNVEPIPFFLFVFLSCILALCLPDCAALSLSICLSLSAFNKAMPLMPALWTCFPKNTANGLPLCLVFVLNAFLSFSVFISLFLTLPFSLVVPLYQIHSNSIWFTGMNVISTILTISDNLLLHVSLHLSFPLRPHNYSKWYWNHNMDKQFFEKGAIIPLQMKYCWATNIPGQQIKFLVYKKHDSLVWTLQNSYHSHFTIFFPVEMKITMQQ